MRIGDRPEPFAHAPMGHHPPGELAWRRPDRFRRRRVYSPNTSFLRRSPAEHENQPALQLRLADVQPVFLGQQLRDAQRPAARNDRHFVQPIDAGHQPGQHGVARLVIGGHRLFFAGEHFFALGAHEHFVAGVLEVVHVDFVFAVARGPQGGFVDQIADVGAGQADGAASQPFEIDVGGQRHAARVNLEDRHAALLIRAIDGDVPIEPAGPQQRRIEHVGPIGGGQHDHRFVRAEAVHFAEDLIERLLAFVVAAAEAGAAMPADGVDFVDEQDRRARRPWPS